MRWTKAGVISLLLVSLLLVNFVAASPYPSPETSVWDTILSIGSLGFLCERSWFGVGSCNYEQNLVAFMRILIGILIFSLLYTGTRAVPGLKENRNIAITVSIILAIISVIFIPSSILIGIGAAYSTLFAVVILAVPIVAGFILYRSMSDENIWFKVAILVLLWLALTGLKNVVVGLLG